MAAPWRAGALEAAMKNILVSLRLLLVLPLRGPCAEPALFSDLLPGE